MRHPALCFASIAMVLSACSPQVDAIAIPDDWDEAAQTCLVAQSLAIRAMDGREMNSPMTFDEFAKTVRFAMVASTKGDTFRPESLDPNPATLDRLADEYADKYADKDVESAVSDCEARFGLDDEDRKPALPGANTDALFACSSMALFMRGSLGSGTEDVRQYADRFAALETRLRTLIQNDPDAQSAIQKSSSRALGIAGIEQAFSQGAPLEYMEACEARFPAEG